jgi:hypothetical protein
MTACIVYESIYGNTRQVAEAIAEGLKRAGQAEIEVLSVDEAAARGQVEADLVVAGGPTHMHGMASSMSRKMAAQAAADDGHVVEPGAAEGPGLRSWLRDQRGAGTPAAAFDTRADASPLLTGMAARGIAKRLRRGGFETFTDPESFLVEDSEGPLAEGELDRARRWGELLARSKPGPGVSPSGPGGVEPTAAPAR